jgi:hypothetical protein
MYLRLRTYCPNPLKDRFSFDLLECSICLTWSLSSALSSLLHPSNDAPWGKTAKRVSLRVESIVAIVAMVPPDSVRVSLGSARSGAAPAAFACACASRAGPSTAFISSRLCCSLGVCRRTYVGRLLTHLPRFGTKREFCTFVKEVMV